MINGIDLQLRVRAIARTFPDRIYDSGDTDLCFYSPDEQNPMGCIIGAAARSLDEDVSVWDSSESSVGVSQLLSDGIIAADKPTAFWLIKVQDFQDGRDTWATAVRLADSAVARGEF